MLMVTSFIVAPSVVGSLCLPPVTVAIPAVQ